MNTQTTHIKTDKQLVPKLRFKEFEAEWENWKVQELLDENYIIRQMDGNHGELYPRSEEFVKEGVPYISANDFISGHVDLKNCKFLTKERASTFRKGIAKNNDVLFAHNATVGPTAILKTDLDFVILSTTATYYRCNFEKLLNLFLKTSFESEYFIRQYSRVMSQSTRNQVPITMQRKFFIHLPTLPEQQKIASFLTAVDTKLQQLTQKKVLLEQYKKGVMQQLFSRQLRFKHPDGSDYPDWEEKKLGEVGRIVSGLTYSPNDIVEDEKGVLVLRSSNVHDRKLHFDDNVYVKVGNFNPVQENDVLICVRNGSKRLIGKNAIIDKSCEGLAFGAFMTVYRSEYNNFLFHYFDSKEYKKEVHRNLGATINSINGGDLKKFKIPFPSKEEQQHIASYLAAFDTKIETLTQQIENTQQFKKGLLQQMFV